jgi:hypothetical protein
VRGRLRKSTIARRMDELEVRLGGEPRCRCGLPPGSPPWARAITSKSPEDFPPDYPFPHMDRPMWNRVVEEPCPDCGRLQLVLVSRFLADLHEEWTGWSGEAPTDGL